MAVKNIYTDLNLQGNKMAGISNAVDANDAVNKSQMDALEVAVKAYTDGKIEGLGEYVTKIDPANGLPTTGSGAGNAIDKQDWYYISVGGTLLGETVYRGDKLMAAVSNPDTTTNDNSNTDWIILDNHSTEDDRFAFSNESLIAGVEKTITHNLGHKLVQVLVTDTSDNVIEASIRLIDTNSIGITSNSDVDVNGIISL